MKTWRSIPSLLLILFVFFQACNNEKSISVLQIEEGYKTINGTELYYKKVGEGEPVIIIHGGPVLDHGYLVPYFQPLTQNYELIYYDQRLSGRSSADVDSAEITLNNFIEDIEGLRQEFNLEKIHLMGHSWGGLLAVKYAIKYPSHLNSLVLLNSIPASSELWRQEQQVQAQNVSAEDSVKRQEIMSSDVFQTDPPQAIKQLLLLSFRSEFYNPSLADSLDFYIPDDYMMRSQKFGYLMPEISDFDLYPQLDSLQIPTLVVYGKMEPAVSISAKQLDSTLPNSDLVIVENTGHFPFIERPETFMNELEKFLSSH